MADLLDLLPAEFRSVRYDGTKIPDGDHDLTDGANCQRYAYAVLAHFGIALPPWRSSELWADHGMTRAVDAFERLDLLLFNHSVEPFGAHVGVYDRDGRVLHLCKSVGLCAVWTLAEFAEQPRYAWLIGGKRAITDKS